MPGDGTLAIKGATVGARVEGRVECIILVNGRGCRVEKTRRPPREVYYDMDGIRRMTSTYLMGRFVSLKQVLALTCKSSGLVYGLWG